MVLGEERSVGCQQRLRLGNETECGAQTWRNSFQTWSHPKSRQCPVLLGTSTESSLLRAGQYFDTGLR